MITARRDRKSNSGTPEYEVGVLTTRQRCSVGRKVGSEHQLRKYKISGVREKTVQKEDQKGRQDARKKQVN
jgi:hypothetical protein